MNIYCCTCKDKVEARLTDGKEVYPHREDLFTLPFWICDTCKNFVGCHHKTKDRTRPLGVIANKEIKNARIHIHSIIDPLYRSRILTRKQIYQKISEHVGWKYHTGNIRTIEEARNIYAFVKTLKPTNEGVRDEYRH